MDESERLAHFESTHPVILADSITMMMMGNSEAEIDEITLTDEYLDGNLPGFRGEKIPGGYDRQRLVMVRMDKGGLFTWE